MASTDRHTNGTSPPPRKRRQRARQACFPCRQRKRKCDANVPCDMCTTYGYECHYPEDKSPVANFALRNHRSTDHHQNATSPGTRTNASIQSPHTNTTDSLQTPKDEEDSTNHDHGIIELTRSRYMASSSSAAFAQAIGQELQSSVPPRLHPFGWSFGLRPEEKAEVHADLAVLITRAEVEQYATAFFASFRDLFDVLDPTEFASRCDAYYSPFQAASTKDTVFAATIAGVVTNASYMSPTAGHPREAELVQYAKRILDDPESVRRPSIDLVLACVLRLIYLRASSSPNTAWLACSAAMHLCEANGLHDEAIVRRLAQVHATSPPAGVPAVDEATLAERYRRLYWIAWTSNMLTSYEFGRTPVLLPAASVADPTPTPGNCLHQQVAAAKTIPAAYPAPPAQDTLPASSASSRTPLHHALAALERVPATSNFVKFTRADLAFAYYRRMRQQRLNVTNDVVAALLRIGDAALEAAAESCAARQPWFNAFGSTFQYACVLIAVDRGATLSVVGRAIGVLESFVGIMDTKETREALGVARLLLRDAMGKKRREIEMLEAVDVSAVFEEGEGVGAGVEGGGGEPGEMMDFGVNWDTIFDNVPYFDGGDAFQFM